MNHNTCITLSGTSQIFTRAANGTVISGWNLRNNIATSIDNVSTAHIFYESSNGLVGTDALNAVAGNTWMMEKNILAFNSSYNFWVSQYPVNNFYVHSINEIGFVDVQNGNYLLNQNSPYKNQGTDGQDPGANIPVLNQRTACTENGNQLSCAGNSQTPYPGPNTPTIPYIIEAENFDNGGEGTAYHENFGTTGSGTYRSGEAVDIQARSTASNGYVVFEAAAGEWLEYTINVPFTRNYDIGVRYSSEFNNGKFHIEIDGTDVTGELTANSTGNWGNFQVVKKRGTQLTSGTHVLRLSLDANSPDSCGCIVANFDSILLKSATSFDYDGDGKTDLSIYRPTSGQWSYRQITNGNVQNFQWGASGDQIVPADYTGDGKTDIAVWRPASGDWYVLKSEDSTFYSFPFGSNGDKPVPADFDGDGKADPTVYRPSNGVWYSMRSTGGIIYQQFGIAEDVPLPNDFDGDGKADLAVYRPTPSEWWVQRSTGGLYALQFGANGDKPVPADFDGDGKTDVALWRPSNGFWYVLRSEEVSFYGFPFGSTGDIPVPGDYDGDGKADPATYRPSNNIWYLLQSTNNFTSILFGESGDIPTPSAYIP